MPTPKQEKFNLKLSENHSQINLNAMKKKKEKKKKGNSA